MKKVNNMTTVNLEWISVNDRLPTIPENQAFQNVKVLGAWNGQWTELYYRRVTVREKIVERFEWQGRICTFPISHWAIPVTP